MVLGRLTFNITFAFLQIFECLVTRSLPGLEFYATERGTPNLKLPIANSVGWNGIRGMSWTQFTDSTTLDPIPGPLGSDHYTPWRQ